MPSSFDHGRTQPSEHGGSEDTFDRMVFMAIVLLSTAFAIALSSAFFRPSMLFSVTTAFLSILMAMALNTLFKPMLDRVTGSGWERRLLHEDSKGKQREMEQLLEKNRRAERAAAEAEEERNEARRARGEAEIRVEEAETRRSEEVTKLKQEIASLQNKAKASERALAIAKEEAGRDQQRQELVRLQQKLKENEQLVANLQALATSSTTKALQLEEDKKLETQRLQIALQDVRARAERAQEDSQRAARDVSRLQQQAGDNERMLAGLRAELSEALGGRSSLERELDDKSQAIARLESELAEAISRRDALQRQMDIFLPFFRRTARPGT